MADFRARITMLRSKDCRLHPVVGPTWICRLRLGQYHPYASLISRGSYFVAERTDLVYATLLDTSARSLFSSGTVFEIVDEDRVAAIGVVEPPDGLPHPSDDILAVLQTWIRRRPEWFIRARLELTEQSAGWSDLVEEALSTIHETVSDRSTSIRVLQIKQKLGALVVYVRHQLSDEKSAIIGDKLNEVHARSLRTCEICGSAGQRGSQSGYVCVRCPDCAPENWSPDHSRRR